MKNKYQTFDELQEIEPFDVDTADAQTKFRKEADNVGFL